MSMNLEDNIDRIINEEYAEPGVPDAGRSDAAAHKIVALIHTWLDQKHALVPSISLRDWFAGMALAEVPDPINEDDAPRTARLAYAIADAMLKERGS